MHTYDLIVIGAGPAGLIAAIQAARRKCTVAILEQLPAPAAKLKATGGGRCNLSNTLEHDAFIEKFGRQGRFIKPALEAFGHEDLVSFFARIGVKTHAPDGFRIFPVSHNSQTIIDALLNELDTLGAKIHLNQKVTHIHHTTKRITDVETTTDTFKTKSILLATGGLGYPSLGATGDGHCIAKELGHTTTTMHPAMMPLRTKEKWVANCTADTIAKATLKVNIKGKHQRACGDLIFTKVGLRGPVILDFSREITPLLAKHHEVPLLVNFTKGMNEETARKHLQKLHSKAPQHNILQHVTDIIPQSLATELCKQAHCTLDSTFKNLSGESKTRLCKLLAWCPLTISGHDGFKMAMITRGGIKLKEVDPETMQSKLLPHLYFCGEILDLDGPCGGYNLTWSFSSGNLAGINIAKQLSKQTS